MQLERIKLQDNGSVKHQVAFYEAQVAKLRAEVRTSNYTHHTLWNEMVEWNAGIEYWNGYSWYLM